LTNGNILSKAVRYKQFGILERKCLTCVNYSGNRSHTTIFPAILLVLHTVNSSGFSSV